MKMVTSVKILMNALMVHTSALFMQLVLTLKVPMPAFVILDTLETDLDAIFQ